MQMNKAMTLILVMVFVRMAFAQQNEKCPFFQLRLK